MKSPQIQDPGAYGAGVLPAFPSRGVVQQPDTNPTGDSPAERLDDETFPAYSMGRAAEILGVTPSFLRSLDAAELLTPQRSPGGHRRYSRYQLRLAARVRQLVDAGNPLEAACRIVILEDQLAEAQQLNTDLQHTLDQHTDPTDPGRHPGTAP